MSPSEQRRAAGALRIARGEASHVPRALRGCGPLWQGHRLSLLPVNLFPFCLLCCPGHSGNGLPSSSCPKSRCIGREGGQGSVKVTSPLGGQGWSLDRPFLASSLLEAALPWLHPPAYRHPKLTSSLLPWGMCPSIQRFAPSISQSLQALDTQGLL